MYEFDLIVGKTDSYSTFLEAWDVWKQAILDYSTATVSQPKGLKMALRDIASDDPGKFECMKGHYGLQI